MLAGCQSNTQTLADDYLKRLANVLSLPRVSIVPVTVPLFPRTRALTIPIDSVRLDLFDAYALRACGLLPFIGERNAVLGQVMPASRALDYEVRLLAQLVSCRDNSDVDQSLVESLYQQKQAQLPQRIWNATIASEEFRQYWRANQSMVTVADGLQTEPVAKILSDWQALANAPQTLSLAELEQHNQQLYHTNEGMAWLKSTLYLNQVLAQANDLLVRAIEQPLCPRGTIPAARYAENVMIKFFVGSLQPHMAVINRHGNMLVSGLQAVDSQLAVDNIAWQEYLQLITTTHRDFHRLNRQHIENWQALLDSCGL